MNATIAQNIRHNRLIEIRQLIDEALADPGPLSAVAYASLTAAKAAIIAATVKVAA
jgi:hypothetical protein